MSPLILPSSSITSDAERFVAEHQLRDAVEGVVGFVRDECRGENDLHLRLIEGDFEGELLLEFMVSTNVDPAEVPDLDDQIHGYIAASIPLEQRVFLIVNFRVV